MSNQPIQPLPGSPESSWSNRILILATAGILFLTMYPFRFNFHPLANGASPFLLGKSGKSGVVDAVLNVLLFVPFGFGLGEKLRERGKSIRFTLALALAAGMVSSYIIEFLQLYVPERDSGWEDVFTNGSGSLIGAAFYIFCGVLMTRSLNSIQRAVVAFLTPVRFACAVVAYFCLWSVVAAVLQQQSQFGNWDPNGTVILGNSGSGMSPRQGDLRSLQMWDHSLSRAAIAARGPHGPDLAQNGEPILEYQPTQLVASPWLPRDQPAARSSQAAEGTSSPLPLQTNGQNLIESWRRTSQFTIHVVCTGVSVPNDDWRIFFIDDLAGKEDMILRQENGHLVMWFRMPLSLGAAQLAWYIPRVFNELRPHDILYSYDGSKLVLYLDGKLLRPSYRLGPGTVLAKIMRRVRPSELELYLYAFHALVFWVGGALMGLLEPSAASSSKSRAPLLEVSAIVLGALALELTLIHVTGRMFSRGYVVLSIFLGLAGLLWARADDRFSWHQQMR